jgi:uncharacterized protein (TIGR02246 family)
MIRGLLLLLVSLAGTGLVAAQSHAVPSADTEAIKALIASYAEAREKEDPNKIEALFTDDADQLVSSGEWRRGREAVVKGTIASSQRTGGTRTITVESVRFLQPGFAIADARYEIAGTAAGTRKMWSTFVVTKSSARWRIAAIRNMLPAVPVPASAAPK